MTLKIKLWRKTEGKEIENMNELIKMLKKHADEQEEEYKKKRHDFEDAEKAYKMALNDETMRKKLILAKKFLKVVDIIHKHDLRCVSMKGVDPKSDFDPYINPLFVVQDSDKCDAYITIQDGVVYGERGEGFDQHWLDKLISDIDKFCETENI